MKKTGKTCCECKTVLKKNEIALCKKIISTDTDSFYCLNCLSEYLDCTTDDLEIKIQEFKEQGCVMFE